MSTNGTPLLAAHGVRKRFGALVVLQDVDFTVGADEAVGIVGPNGAGKTTLLNVLAGSLQATSGSVRFRDADVTPTGSARRCRLGIARAHQVPRPFGGMTVFENVFVAATTGGRSQAQGRLSRLRSTRSRPAACSTSPTAARRRWGCSTASGSSWRARSPPIPSCCCWTRSAAGLTDAEADELVETIRELNGRGIAIVWIEHIVHVLVQVADAARLHGRGAGHRRRRAATRSWPTRP